MAANRIPSGERRTYLTNDGASVTGTPREVVRALRAAQWNAPEKKRQWMEQVAERVEHLGGARERLRFNDAEEFLAELVRVGLLRLAD